MRILLAVSSSGMRFVTDPLCEVERHIEGDQATLLCRMTYKWQAEDRLFNHPPKLDVSLSWTGVTGTTQQATADPTTSSGTLETRMTVDGATPDTIESQSCTITFDLSPGINPFNQYAVNSLSYTCRPSSTPARKCH